MSDDQKTRLLFVDDEPSIRVTVPLILERHGFEVTTVESVKAALQAIATKQFDVLLTDLNIGQPGDGFTVVSAMRRTQPEVATVILTGYPAFETALAAIRSQVDDYLIKPSHPDELVNTLREKLKNRGKGQVISSLRLPELILQNRDAIMQSWLASVEQDPDISRIKLDRAARVDHFPLLLDEVVRKAKNDGPLPQEVVTEAEVHGRLRRQQGYTIPLMVKENRLFRMAISRFTQENLIAVEISYVIADMLLVDNTLGTALEISMATFLEGDTVTPK